MIRWRVLPPVVTPITTRDLMKAAAALLPGARDSSDELRAALIDTYGRHVIALTDSATSALVTLLEHLASPAGIVAIPGFGCIDVAAAVQGARMRAIPYDVDPFTLAPDSRSLLAALERGARVVIASHLFGFAIPLDAVRAMCASFNAVLIEDAAQAFGAAWDGRPAGSLGTYSVLSFGRGKGIGGGGGGAALSAPAAPLNEMLAALTPTHGWFSELTTLVRSGLVQVINRPSLYALPAAIPSLRLGEMVYHRAQAPRGIGSVSAALARLGLRRMRDGNEVRAERALRLVASARRGKRCTPLEPASVSTATWLRAPMLLCDGSMPPATLGVYRPYPCPVPEQAEIREILVSPLPSLPGARRLSRQLVTLPTHARLSERDMRALEQWLTSDTVVV